MLQSIAFLAFALVARRAFAFTSSSPPSLLHTSTSKSSVSSRRLPLYSSTPTNIDASPILPTRAPPPISQVDVLYGSRTSLVYDAALERYVPATNSINSPTNDSSLDTTTVFNNNNNNKSNAWIHTWRRSILIRLQHSFLPEGVTPSYYRFIAWRIIQRFLNAYVHVFGTTFLLMGLGLKNHNIGLTAGPQLGPQGCMPGQNCENDVGGKHGTQV